MKNVLCIAALAAAIWAAGLYSAPATVAEVDGDAVTFETNGHLFGAVGCGEWQEGDQARILMHDGGTAERRDDIIIYVF